MATVELTTNLLVEIGGWPALKEARGLVERGRVTNARREGDVIRARVQGAEKVHEPQITLAERVANIEVRCTCAESRRTGRVCPHALAAGLALLQPVKAQPVAAVYDRRRESQGDAVGGHRPPLQTAPPMGTSAATQRQEGTAIEPMAATTERQKVTLRLRADGGLDLIVKEGKRVVPREKIPDFLTREWSGLERSHEVILGPGFEEFRLEIGQPMFEARLDGALSGLTLELVARYGAKGFSLGEKTEPSVYQQYWPEGEKSEKRRSAAFPAEKGSGPLFSYLRRNVIAERQALAQVAAAGFKSVRSGGTTFSLLSENAVARFLANTLPRWRQVWGIIFGTRLEATMRDVDIAEPEFSLRSGSGEDWLSLDLKLSVGGKPVALDQAEIQRWLQTGQSHARTANKRVLLVPTEAWGEMKEVLADCEVEQEPGKISLKRTYAPFLSGALTAQGFRVGENGAGSFTKPDVESSLDEKLWNQLRPYQAQGVEWLAGLAAQNFNGLLADDMGLGKTLQALAFAAWLKKGEEDKSDASTGHQRIASCALRAPGQQEARATRAEADEAQLRGQVRSQVQLGNEGTKATATLVVCPTSLVTNWLREAARFTPQLRTLDLTGADRAQKWARRGECDLLVTSYAILRRDIELYRAEEFALVILDEAQHIKNRGSQNAQSAKALKAKHRLILTGTPLENSVLDLWSLYDFLLPGYLGSATDFKERYETPLTKEPQPKTMERLRHKVRPFFLRRTKEEVLTELPPKLDYPTLCELSDEQREVYRAILAQGRREVFEHSDKAGRKSGRDRLAVLTTLLRLRQVCCHLDLLPGGDGGKQDQITKFSKLTKLEEGRREGTSAEGVDNLPAASCSLREPGQQVVRATRAEPSPGGRRLPTESRWKEPSAKMERTFELIDEAMDGGHRVLLFSQFVQVLHLLREEAKRRSIPFCYLDGQTVERQAEVDRFQNEAGIPLFFISLKAGGTGLNLTGADTVIHFDPWWNPAVEEQATARAHRMGQARRVSAYKLIAAGTVEEKIQALQARKRELFEASLGGDEAFVEKLTGEEIEELLA